MFSDEPRMPGQPQPYGPMSSLGYEIQTESGQFKVPGPPPSIHSSSSSSSCSTSVSGSVMERFQQDILKTSTPIKEGTFFSVNFERIEMQNDKMGCL